MLNAAPSKKKPKEILYNQSKRAEALLDHVLDEDTPEEIIEQDLSTTTIDEARNGVPIVQRDSARTMSRILFITKDVTYLEENSKAVVTLRSLGTLFDEIHVIVMVPLGVQTKSKRFADNVWVHNVSAYYWWLLPFAAIKEAKVQLMFNGRFRPDIIVALDPFESGVAALRMSQIFDRPFQIHISENFLAYPFLKQEKNNTWRKKVAAYVLDRAQSVRTSTGGIFNALEQQYPHIMDLQALPQFHNFKSLLNAKPAFDVHEKYKDFVFSMLAVGPLTSDSHLHNTFSALNDILHNPRIGLIVMGDGPAKSLFEQKVALLGIAKNVVFVSTNTNLVSYLKTSDVLIQTDTSKIGDEIVFKAAAAGLPMIMFENDMRRDLFEDGISATLCEDGDSYTLGRHTKTFLNNAGLRIRYKEATPEIVKNRLMEDEATYYRALRDSIESVVAASESAETQESVPHTQPKGV